MVWILEQLWKDFGGEINSKGFKVLDPHVRVLWGDGIHLRGIEKILGSTQLAGFSAENMVFGMGGGLLQKVDRDTQRFAFKCSAQERNGEWIDIYKDPIDSTKKSKKGRLMLLNSGTGYHTVPLEENCPSDLLQTVYSNGVLLKSSRFEEIRERAALPQEKLIAA
jgi:nicotinamide phosphoribosyltransferase